MLSLREKFENIGGSFVASERKIQEALETVNTYIFDWDGVFNLGVKEKNTGSSFSEIDSMGVNMLRFSHWLLFDEIPNIFIITGVNNLTAIEFAKREHFDGVFLNYANKREAVDTIQWLKKVEPHNMAFVFDDILDIDASRMCQLAFAVRRDSSVLFKDFLIQNDLCHYMSGNGGAGNAVREICELIIGMRGNFEDTINKRIEFINEYKIYLNSRNKIETVVYDKTKKTAQTS